MREIKFRAWHKIHKKYINSNNLIDGIDVWIDNFGIKLQYNEDIILEEFTGIKDILGKEIFEGDIITYEDLWGLYPYTVIGFVYYDNTRGTYKVKHSESTELYIDRNLEYTFYESGEELTNVYKVIGNIHENKDLL